MERIDRPSQTPAIPVLSAMSEAAARFVRNLFANENETSFGGDVAFSDDLERRLNERELHAW